MRLIKDLGSENMKVLISRLQNEDIIGFDVEASSLDVYESVLLLIQISFKDRETFVINVGKADPKIIRYVLELIHDRNILTIGHNFKFDAKMIYHHFGILFKNPFDTMLTETLTKPGVSMLYPSLDDLLEKYFNIRKDMNIRHTFYGKTDFDFTPDQYNYASRDVEFLIPMAEIQGNLIDRIDMQKVWKMEMNLIPVIAMMEYQGISFDQKSWMALAKIAEQKSQEYESKTLVYMADNFHKIAPNTNNALEAIDSLSIREDLAGGKFTAKFRRKQYEQITPREEIVATVIPLINMASPKQVVNILNKLGISTKSSSEKELQRFRGNEFVDLLLNYRGYFKKSTAFGEEFLKYVNPITSKIHTDYSQLGAVTGRWASSNPNMQQIIADFLYRACFIALPSYKLVTLDYSQIELRLMAETSGESLMIDAFNNGVDLHALTASLVFDIPLEKVTDEKRQVGKTLNFAVIYGTTEYGLNYNFGWSLEQGKEYLDKFFSQYKTLSRFLAVMGSEIIKRGYSTTHYGRRRYLTYPKSPVGIFPWLYNKKISKAKRQGINQIIQGDAAEILKLAMLDMFHDNPFGWEKFRMLLQVHDELVLEVHDSLVETYYEDGEEKFRLNADAKTFVDKCMLKPANYFLNRVPIEYNSKVDKVWIK